jgi:AcrR family transcriptional regulator
MAALANETADSPDCAPLGADRPADSVRCIVYISHSLGVWGEAALRDLAARAGWRNAALCVTGRLLHLDECFIQALEGPPPHVEAVWKRIQQDGRHTDIETLLDICLPERSFPGWSMDYVSAAEITGPEAATLRAIIWRSRGGAATGETDGGMALALLKGAGKSFGAEAFRTLPSQDRSMQTVARILAAARRLAARAGVATITQQAVADEAGVSLKSVYRYFSTFDDIARAIVRERQLVLISAYKTRLALARFSSDAEVAQDVANVIGLTYLSDSSLSLSVRLLALRRYHEIAYAELWGLAGAILAAIGRSGLDVGDATMQARIAMALAGCAGATKMAALHDPAQLRSAAFRDMIVHNFLTALRGPSRTLDRDA